MQCKQKVAKHIKLRKSRSLAIVGAVVEKVLERFGLIHDDDMGARQQLLQQPHAPPQELIMLRTLEGERGVGAADCVIGVQGDVGRARHARQVGHHNVAQAQPMQPRYVHRYPIHHRRDCRVHFICVRRLLHTHTSSYEFACQVSGVE